MLLTKYNIFLILILFSSSVISIGNVIADIGNQHTITVRYANDTSTGYVISATSNQGYTISQRHSWSEDSSRYNLQAYSIDNGPIIPVNRAPDGNFTLDVSTNSNHVVVFITKPQFELVIHGTNNVTFFPPCTFKSSTIHMSSMHDVNLEYKTQYYVKVISNFGRALGTGWYNSGTIVDASVIPGNDGIVNHVFSGWQGSIIGNQNQMSVETLADSPKTLVANWSADYTNVSIIAIVIIAALVFGIIYQKRRAPLKTG